MLYNINLRRRAIARARVIKIDIIKRELKEELQKVLQE